MKRLFLVLFLGSIIFGCAEKQTDTQKSVPNFSEARDAIEIQFIMNELGKLVDSTYTETTKLNSIIVFKIIDQKGNIRPIGMEKAIKLYLSNIEDNTPNMYPIFEIKGTSKVILPVFGKGLWDKIWAKIVIDKKTMKVMYIEFEHKAETPGLGAVINEPVFENKFVGSTISLEAKNYALYKNDEKIMDGNQRIDAIAGATITSQGAIEMLNKGLLKYKMYLH